jgi:hypothetical protein
MMKEKELDVFEAFQLEPMNPLDDPRVIRIMPGFEGAEFGVLLRNGETYSAEAYYAMADRTRRG